MGNGMNKVLPGLYVGNYRDSKDSAQLDKFEITHILAIHDAARRLHSDKHYLCLMAADTPDQNLIQYFPVCNDFIHAARLRGGNVLIHCLAGMSRSVTVAIAYIMSVTTLTWKEALKVVRVGRSVANPNWGFLKQLQEYERTRLDEERRRLKERFPSLALVEQDQLQCRQMLSSYEDLLMSKKFCEGNCLSNDECPTGMCRTHSTKRSLRRKPSTSSLNTPPQSPRLLPPTPRPTGGTNLSRSTSSVSCQASPNLSRRPRSGPAGLHSYTGSSCPASRIGSRLNVSEIAPGVLLDDLRSRTGSAPTSPRVTPPVSPQHWTRRTSTLVKRTPSTAQITS